MNTDPSCFWSYWMDYAERNRDVLWAAGYGFGSETEEEHPGVCQDHCCDCGASPWDCGCTHNLLSHVGD